MTVNIERPVQYYDLPAEEEELSQSFIHHFVIKTLSGILENMYEAQNVKVVSSINMYYPEQAAVAPDVAVVDGLVTRHRSGKGRGSYYVSKDNPPPRVAFEIASDETWSRDLDQKLGRYERMGTREYFVFDPNNPQVWSKEWRKKGRLLGWRLDTITGLFEPIQLAKDGRMWSKELESWLTIELVEDDPYLRLYDRANKRRLTVDEAKVKAQRQVRRVKRIARRSQAERQIERQQLETERQQLVAERQIERQQLETERQQAELRARQAEAELAELRRQLQSRANGNS